VRRHALSPRGGVGLLSSVDGDVDVLGASLGDIADGLASRRVNDLERLLLDTVNKLAAARGNGE
jgi:hypothetical protein